MSLKDHIDKPRKEWTRDDWLKHAQMMVHSPWINEEDRDYWKYKVEELRK
jgi:hypothetical protein